MLIDSNAYIGNWPFRKLDYNSCKSLVGRMDQFRVDLSLISNMNGVFYKNTQSANEELYKEVNSNKNFKRKFIPIAVINPVYNGWRDDLNLSIGRYGMKGVRIFPKYHRYELSNPNCIELVKRCRDLDVPVILSLRMVDKRPSSWLDIDEEWALKDVMSIIKEVPDAKYHIVNIANSPALNEEDTDLLKRSKILMDTSGRALANLGVLIKKYGSNKFAFGTHSPILDYTTGLLRIEGLYPNEADEQTKNLLRSGNVKSFFKL